MPPEAAEAQRHRPSGRRAVSLDVRQPLLVARLTEGVGRRAEGVDDVERVACHGRPVGDRRSQRVADTGAVDRQIIERRDAVHESLRLGAAEICVGRVGSEFDRDGAGRPGRGVSAGVDSTDCESGKRRSFLAVAGLRRELERRERTAARTRGDREGRITADTPEVVAGRAAEAVRLLGGRHPCRAALCFAVSHDGQLRRDELSGSDSVSGRQGPKLDDAVSEPGRPRLVRRRLGSPHGGRHGETRASRHSHVGGTQRMSARRVVSQCQDVRCRRPGRGGRRRDVDAIELRCRPGRSAESGQHDDECAKQRKQARKPQTAGAQAESLPKTSHVHPFSPPQLGGFASTRPGAQAKHMAGTRTTEAHGCGSPTGLR